MLNKFFGAVSALTLLSTAAVAGPNDSVWTQLFNPKDSLSTNWDVKIRGEALNADSRRTFRRAIVGSDTVIEVNYDQYTGAWGGDGGPFGHAAYKVRPFSYYLLRGDYQVWGTQATGGPSWAVQNNGFMLHSQSMATMTLNQDFPISMEAQLLGPGNNSSGGGSSSASTMNLCTPGTGFSTTPTGSTSSTHCTPAKPNTRAALNTGWQKVSALILGDSVHTYYAGPNGTDSVLRYYKPVYLAGNISNPPSGVPANGTRLTGGYITIQSETHPFRFRKIEVLNLEGCMRPTTDANYKSYLIKHDSTACAGVAGIKGTSPQDARFASPMSFIGNAVKIGGTGMVTLQVFDISGSLVGTHTALAPFQWTPAVKQSGMHVIRAMTPKGTYAEKATLF